MPYRLQDHNEKSLTVGSTSWSGRDRVVFHGKRFSGVLAAAGPSADCYPSGGRGGYRRRICLVRAAAPRVGLSIPQYSRRRSAGDSACASASSCNTSQYPKGSTPALSIRHLLPNLSGPNCRRRVHAWKTRSQALAIANLTVNSALLSAALRLRLRCVDSTAKPGR
jgi:hypothetical protein